MIHNALLINSHFQTNAIHHPSVGWEANPGYRVIH